MTKKEALEIAKGVRDNLKYFNDPADEIGLNLYSFNISGINFNVFAFIRKEMNDNRKYYAVYAGVEFDGGDTVYADYDNSTSSLNITELADTLWRLANMYTEQEYIDGLKDDPTVRDAIIDFEEDEEEIEATEQELLEEAICSGFHDGYLSAVNDMMGNLIRNCRTELIDDKITLFVTDKKIQQIAETMMNGFEEPVITANNDDWIPVSSGSYPNDLENVQVTYIGAEDDEPYCDEFAYRDHGRWFWPNDGGDVYVEIIAWKHNCEPYREL